jgi:predicted dehydrogenase
VDIVGVCDTSEERALEAGRRCGIPHIYQDVASMLEESHPDVVHVLTPPQSHKELSIQAMEAGCHVLVEKPMALNATEADEMIASSRRHRVTLCVCHTYLFNPGIMKARELVAQGATGEVVAVETFWGYFHPWMIDQYRKAQWLYDLPGGIFHESAPHIVYLQMEFLKDLRVVSAIGTRMGNVLPLPVDDELRVLFGGESGLGSLSLSVNTKPYLRSFSIHGTDMTVQVDLTNSTVVTFTRSRPWEKSKNIEHGLQLLSNTVSNSIRNRLGRRIPDHRLLIERFYESLLKGTAPPVTAEDGRAVITVLDQIWAELDRTAPVQRTGNKP